jgi:hypothetical protein
MYTEQRLFMPEICQGSVRGSKQELYPFLHSFWNNSYTRSFAQQRSVPTIRIGRFLTGSINHNNYNKLRQQRHLLPYSVMKVALHKRLYPERLLSIPILLDYLDCLNLESAQSKSVGPEGSKGGGASYLVVDFYGFL